MPRPKPKQLAGDDGGGYAGDELVSEGRSQYSTGRIHKKHKVTTSVWDLARERTREVFKLFDTVVVSFSGGKDSTVVLHLALEAAAELGRGPVPAMFFDEEAIPFETEHYVREVAAWPSVDMRWYSLPIQHRNACTRRDPYWYPWAPEDQAKWVRPLPPESITWDKVPGFPAERTRRPSMPASVGLLFPALDFGRVGMLMGIRADESLTRTRAVLMSTPDTRPYIRKWDSGSGMLVDDPRYVHDDGNLFKAYPIYDWSTQDVWTAPGKFGWPYNKAYDLMELAGLGHFEQRCAPPFGEEPLRGLWTYRVCFPDIWDKMQSRVPGAATAARYSQTELYSFGGRPPKPKGMPWAEFVRSWLLKHPQPYRGQIAERVKFWLELHHKKAPGEPIAPTAPHYKSGVSWEFLLMIAVRGDYKGRKQPPVPPDPVRAKTRYQAEIAGSPAAELQS